MSPVFWRSSFVTLGYPTEASQLSGTTTGDPKGEEEKGAMVFTRKAVVTKRSKYMTIHTRRNACSQACS